MRFGVHRQPFVPLHHHPGGEVCLRWTDADNLLPTGCDADGFPDGRCCPCFTDQVVKAWTELGFRVGFTGCSHRFLEVRDSLALNRIADQETFRPLNTPPVLMGVPC